MKTAVVYYTRDGNTRIAAEILAQKYEADVFELEEKKMRGKSAGSFIAAGFGASIGRCSQLKNTFKQETDAYDTIFIGSPVWAGKNTPAVNMFIREMNVKGKQIILFTLQADEHPEAASAKGIERLKSVLEKRGAAGFKTLRMHGAPPGKTSGRDEIQSQIAAWNME